MTTEEEVIRAMNFLSACTIGKTVLTLEQVNYWLDNYSDTLFCNGELRQVNFKELTPSRYQVNTTRIL